MTDAGQSEFGHTTNYSKTDAAKTNLDARSRISKTQMTSTMINEDSESDEERLEIPKKFKADTDHKNNSYEQSMRQRTIGAVSDF